MQFGSMLLGAVLTFHTAPVLAAEESFGVLYVANSGQEDTFIPLEVVSPSLKKASADVRASWALFRADVSKRFHVAGRNDDKKYSGGKCIVQMHFRAFQVVCWSERLGKGIDALEQWFESEDSEQVLEFLRQFSAKHFERLRDSVLKRGSKWPLYLT